MIGAHAPVFGRLLAILLISGYCSLVYQMVWLRLLRLVFGASTASSAAVVAIFMGGLGLGGWILGTRVDRAKNPLLFYAGLETAIALFALVTPPLVELVSWGYAALGGTQALGLVGGTVLRIVLATLVLGPATFFMGGTLPAAARAVERIGDRGRRDVGLLYGVNTLGAVAGALWTTFVAVEWLGLRKTLWLAVLLNLLIAVFARALSRSGPAAEDVSETSPEEAATPLPEPGRVRAVLGAAGLVGFAFFLMELVWYRMLSPILGGSSYTFGLILAVALAGIGAGGLAYGYGRQKRRPTFRTFAGTCALQALAVVVPLALGDRIALLALQLRDLGSAGFGGLVFGWAVVTLVVVFPASFVAGYQFPLLIGLLGSGRRRVGREVGLAYAWNTAGAILGSLAGGFGLLPLLSAPGAWRWVAGLLVLLALAALALDRSRPGRKLVPAVCAGLAAGLLLAPGPSAVWRHGGIGAGRMQADFTDPNEQRRAFDAIRATLIWEADGRESSVALLASDQYAFLVNGKSDGSARNDAPTTVFIGMVGAFLHPEPKNSMVIGLGTGTTAGWLADVPTMERVDVAEIEPEIARVAEACWAVNRGVMDNPKVRLFFGDARELLMTSDQRYDLIASEPSNPYRAGISSLFSQEFYVAVLERLSADGLFLQWLQGYEIDNALVRTAYATLASVFPHVETWQIHRNDLLLVASPQPYHHELERIRHRAAHSPYRDALRDLWGVSGAEGFYSGYVASPAFARDVAAQEADRINTDDHPIIEFGFARNLGRRDLFSVSDLAQTAADRDQDRPPELEGQLDWVRVWEMNVARQLLLGVPLKGSLDNPSGDDVEGLPPYRLRSLARWAYARERHEEAVRFWRRVPSPPTARADRLRLAHSLALLGDDDVEAALDRLAEVQATEAMTLRALWHQVRGEDLAAARTFVDAFTAYRHDPWPLQSLMGGALEKARDLAGKLGRSEEPKLRQAAAELLRVFEEPFAVALLDRSRRYERLNAILALDYRAHCLDTIDDVEPYPDWSKDVLRQRLRCYALHDDPRAATAERDLMELLDHEPAPLFDPGRPTPGSADQDRETGFLPSGGGGDG